MNKEKQIEENGEWISVGGNAGALLGKILDFKPWNKKGDKTNGST